MKLNNSMDLEGGIQFCKGITGVAQRDTYLSFETLDAGVYYAFVEVDWKDNKVHG